MMSDASRRNGIIPALTLVLDAGMAAEGKRWFDNLAAQRANRNGLAGTFWAQGFRQGQRSFRCAVDD